MKKTIHWLMVTALAIGWLLCPIGKVAVAENVIKVGHINPLTGPASPWGLPCARGVELMADIINETGGVTVQGKKYVFNVYTENDKFSAEGARAAVEKLLNREKVKYIVGVFTDASILNARHLANEKKVIILQGSSGDAFTIGPKYPYVFRFSQDPRGKLGVLDAARQSIKFKKMAILNTDQATGRGNSKAADSWAKEMNVEITDNLIAPAATSDFYPFLKKIIDHQAEMIHGAISPGKFALVCKQAHELGYKGYYSNVGSMTNVEQFIQIAGQDAVQGYIAPFEVIDCPVITPVSRYAMLEMQKRYLDRFGPPFEPLAWRYAVGMQVLAQALERAQTFDADAVVKTMEKMTFSTLLGTGSFAGKKTYGIPRQLIIYTIAGVIKGNEVGYLGYTRVERP